MVACNGVKNEKWVLNECPLRTWQLTLINNSDSYWASSGRSATGCNWWVSMNSNILQIVHFSTSNVCEKEIGVKVYFAASNY